MSLASGLRHARFLSSGALNISKVGVIGMGLMGHGIVQTAAQKGKKVVGYDVDDANIKRGMSMIHASLEKIAEKKGEGDRYVQEVLKNVESTTDLEALNDCDLIVEAIVENIDVKKKLFAGLGKATGASTILASNTSSLPIGAMAEASGDPGRVIGLHYFNPVQMMKLVEIVGTDKTREDVMKGAIDFVTSIGKVPVTCKDTPGFIVNRLLVPSIAQAILMYDRGDASREDIDTAMKLGAGHPMGPLQLADFVGLDTLLFILQGWVKDYPDEPAFIIPESLLAKVREGKLGRKTGEGYYQWEGNKIKK